MYLKNIIIRNSGPLEKIDIEMPFNEDGTPKPVIFVGENGSGKTILLSSIVDALYEVFAQIYEDLLPPYKLGHKFYKLASPKNKRVNAEYSMNYIQIESDGILIHYLDKDGSPDYEKYLSETNNNIMDLRNQWKSDQLLKITTDIKDNNNLREDIYQNSYAYFPSNRFELPHWINTTVNDDEFEIYSRFSSELKKPITVNSCFEDTKKWILDVFLDSKVEPNTKDKNGRLEISRVIDDKNQSFLPFYIGRKNIDNILSEILQIDCKIGINIKGYGLSRLAIFNNNDDVIIPTLDNLSFGQITLFNLFSTIIKYSAQNNAYKTLSLDQIKGIAVIDEIDAHLHCDLQYKVLPELISLFPKVQFVITSHSPLFLIGLRKKYGDNKFKVIELPNGESISVHRYSEFENSKNTLNKIKKDEEELITKIDKANNKIIICEGQTDVDYIKKAAALFNKNIDHYSFINGGGKDYLNAINKKNKWQDKKILLLYDCDAKKGNSGNDMLFVRTIKLFENNPIKTGIENLFNTRTITKLIKENKCFIDHIISLKEVKNGIQNDIKNQYKINSSQKTNICKWLCEHGTISDFKNYSVVFNVIDAIFSESSLSIEIPPE